MKNGPSLARRSAVALRTLLGIGLAAFSSACVNDIRVGHLADEFSRELRRGNIEAAEKAAGRLREASDSAYGVASAAALAWDLGIADGWSRAGQHDRAIAAAAATLADAEARFGRGEEGTAVALAGLAHAQLASHRWAEAEATVDRIADACRGPLLASTISAKRDGDCRIRMRFEIANLYLGAGAWRKWADVLLQAEADRNEAADHASGVTTLAALGRGYAEYGAYAQSLWYLERCVDESRSRYLAPREDLNAVWTAPGGDVELAVLDSAHSFPTEAPRCLEDLIDVQTKLGNGDEAARLTAWQSELWTRGPDIEGKLVRKLRIAKQNWGDGFLISSAANDLAYYYAGKGILAQAIVSFQEALASIDHAQAQAGGGGDVAAWLEVDELLGLARCCLRTARFDEAAAASRRAAELAARDLPPGHAWRLDALSLLALSASRGTRPSEAPALWRDVVDAALALRGPDHADYASALTGLADALRTVGQNREAVAAASRAAPIRSAAARRIASMQGLPLPASLLSPPSPAN